MQNKNNDIVQTGIYHNKTLGRWELWEVDSDTQTKKLLGFCDEKMGTAGLQILEYDYRDWYLTEDGMTTKVKDYGVSIH